MPPKNDILPVMLKITEITTPDVLSRQIIDKDKLAELKKSIKELGLMNPITVRKLGDKYILCAGYRRFLACRELNLEMIPCMVTISNDTEFNQRMMDENFARADLTFLEEALFLQYIMVSENCTQKVLAKKVNKSESYISERLNLLSFDKEVIDAIQAKQISLRVGSMISKINNPTRRLRVLQQVIENGASETIVSFWVNEANIEPVEEHGTINESEFIPSTPTVNGPTDVFCNICHGKTDYMNSNFIRVCRRCFEISHKNLGPTSQENPTE
ncbi:MAG: ParB/RepB/Spo0J family partition protein [Sphaerochaeta sp.]|jgi:ParB/RepB/Spo0J family partition protein|nr:ParB/RepB/Spo0J family partition protein [Sphaerochaeta sp.]